MLLYIFHHQIQSFQTIEKLIHLVERNFPVHDNQVMPADLNNDHDARDPVIIMI